MSGPEAAIASSAMPVLGDEQMMLDALSATDRQAALPVEVAEKRKFLFLKINQVVALIKELHQAEDDEYAASKKYNVSSVQSESNPDYNYHEIPMACLGTISTYDGEKPAVWVTMHDSVARAFCYD